MVGIPTTGLVVIIQGGEPSLQGTWIHPKLAIELGRWISVEFAIWCDTHIQTLMTTGKTEIIHQQPERALPPVRDVIEYVEAHKYIAGISDLSIRDLLRDQLEDELSTRRGKAIASAKPIEYTIGKVRATELGYTLQQIGNGSALGKFLAKNVPIAYAQRVGKYEVNHYEVNDVLDTAIHSYFGMKASLAA